MKAGEPKASYPSRHPVDDGGSERAGGSLCAGRGGNLTIMTALSFTIVLGFAGLGIDVSSWYSEKRRMQTAADAAAMAGASELSRPNASTADVIAAGMEAAGCLKLAAAADDGVHEPSFAATAADNEHDRRGTPSVLLRIRQEFSLRRG